MIKVSTKTNFTHKNTNHKFLGSINELGFPVDLYKTTTGYLARYGEEIDDVSSVNTEVVKQPFMLGHSCRIAKAIDEGILK